RDGYGWSEFVAHNACSDQGDFTRFFFRAGAWLAIFHCFASADMHQENLIACADHPIPIDLEMILQGTFYDTKPREVEEQAFEIAMQKVTNSVTTVGIVRAYGTFSESLGQTRAKSFESKREWKNVNTDGMSPVQSRIVTENAHLPHARGSYAE